MWGFLQNYLIKLCLLKVFTIILFCLLFFLPNRAVAYRCSPSRASIGDIITVNSVAELEIAFSTVNRVGGNRTILISDGVYLLRKMLYLRVDNVVVRSKSGNREKVLLKGGGMQGPVKNIFLLRGSNITIADLSCGEISNHGMQIMGEYGARNILIHNVRIFNTGQQMIKGTYDDRGSLGSEKCTIECSLLEYTNHFGPQYYIGGIDVHRGNRWIVRDNIFRNIRSPDQKQLAEHAIHFWSGSKDSLVERNTIINCDRGIGFGLGNRPHFGGIIRNNMICNDGAGFNDDVAIGLENSEGSEVYNNSIYMEQKYPNAIEYRFPGTNKVMIFNNLTNRAIADRDGALADVSNNITTASQSWFMDTKNCNLRLAQPIEKVVDTDRIGAAGQWR